LLLCVFAGVVAALVKFFFSFFLRVSVCPAFWSVIGSGRRRRRRKKEEED
jgi:hypothetical protein